MRYISLLLALVILGYTIKFYLDSSGVTTTEEATATTRPRQTIERAEQGVDQINRALQEQQQRLNDNQR